MSHPQSRPYRFFGWTPRSRVCLVCHRGLRTLAQLPARGSRHERGRRERRRRSKTSKQEGAAPTKDNKRAQSGPTHHDASSLFAYLRTPHVENIERARESKQREASVLASDLHFSPDARAHFQKLKPQGGGGKHAANSFMVARQQTSSSERRLHRELRQGTRLPVPWMHHHQLAIRRKREDSCGNNHVVARDILGAPSRGTVSNEKNKKII